MLVLSLTKREKERKIRQKERKREKRRETQRKREKSTEKERKGEKREKDVQGQSLSICIQFSVLNSMMIHDVP